MPRTDCSAPRPRRVLAVALFVVGLLVLALVGPAGTAQAAHTPKPYNPSDNQINSAAEQKAAVAAEVGRLAGQIAKQQTELQKLQAAQEMAEQVLAWKLSLLEQAKADAVKAKANVATAERAVAAAQQQFAAFAQASYMSGSISGMTGTLLTADDPNVVLQQGSLEEYESDHQLDAIGSMKRATVAKANADAAARRAVQKQKSATAAAAQAKSDADAAVVAAIAQEKQLEASLAQNQKDLAAAQLKLATLNNQRTQFIAYTNRVAEIHAWQAKVAAFKIKQAEFQARQAARKARIAAAAAAAKAERLRQQEAARQRQLAAQRASSGGGSNGDNSGSSGSSDGGSSYTPPAATQPTGGGWSAAKGQDAVNRAMNYLGTMYAWAGGNSSGPTLGVCAGDGAYNDCHVRGFDCSGLALYAWAPYKSFPHYSVSQYNVGSYHPSISNLLPGDLVFWSSNGAQSGVHHVAIYIGNGNVIQAPQSGSVIQITPLLNVSWGYFGATRPLS